MPEIAPSGVGNSLLDDPVAAYGGSMTRMFSVDRADLPELQRAALTTRFAELRDRIPLLTRLADRQGIDTIDQVDDVIPLLFDHTFYKSYPSSLIDKHRFDELTRWLSKLTTVDLSGVEASGCESLDAWLDLVDADSELRLCHSSGTSGTLSFIPWTKRELNALGGVHATVLTQDFGVDEDVREAPGIDVIFPYFRSGGGMFTRLNELMITWIAKGPERHHAAFPGRLSSDVMYLAGKLRAAAARGQAHQVKVDPALLARKEEFDRLMAEMPQRLERYLDELVQSLAGKTTFTISVWHTIHNLALSGLAKGHHRVFAPDSMVIFGGGMKGTVPPAGWDDDIREFFGVQTLRTNYSMSELTLSAPRCQHGRMHFNPWIVPFVLDPDTSKPRPREGRQTGRAALFDLALSTRWGGFITGDEITIDWDVHCPCGLTTVACESEIARLSEKRGGDDKISCVATEEAHQDALEYLTSIETAL
jgi:hypothetical protein